MEKSVEERVREVIEQDIKPLLAMEGGDIELVSVEDGVVKVRLRGTCAGCPFSQITLSNFVEATLKEKCLRSSRSFPLEVLASSNSERAKTQSRREEGFQQRRWLKWSVATGAGSEGSR